jgi:dienelactone hydrolase
MRRPIFAGVLLALSHLALPVAQEQAEPEFERVTVASGPLKLSGLLFRPNRSGAVPAILFHHGGGCTASRLPVVLGSRFVKQGYAFLWVYRRGVGPSAGQGDCATQEINQTRAEKGEDASLDVALRRMTTDELDDAFAGLAALRATSGIDAGNIVVAGHSRGGQLALLTAERDTRIRAVMSFAGGAAAWGGSAALRARLVKAVGAISVPAYLAYAEDDNAEPGRALAAEFLRLKRPHQLVVYPTGGHGFIFLDNHPSDADMFRFLTEHARR